MTKRPDRLLTDFPRDPIDDYWSPNEPEAQDVTIGRVKLLAVIVIVGGLTFGAILGVRWLLGDNAAFALAGFLAGYAVGGLTKG